MVAGKSDTGMQGRLDSAMADVNDKYLLLEETEKNSVRQALIEERGRFCLFISCLKPVVVSIIHQVAVLWIQMLVLDCSSPHCVASSLGLLGVTVSNFHIGQSSLCSDWLAVYNLGKPLTSVHLCLKLCISFTKFLVILDRGLSF